MRSPTQLAGMILTALGVAVGLRAAFHWESAAMTALGAGAAVAGVALIFRGHHRRR